MMPGPTEIVACPRCGALTANRTIASGNLLLAQYWTDGKVEAPMMPMPPEVVSCRRCGDIHWLAEAKRVGSYRYSDPAVDPAWRDAPQVEEPTQQGYHAALAAGLARDTREERNLRILAWRRANDAFRHQRDLPVMAVSPLAEADRLNLRALLPLLATHVDEDLLLRAEVLRELGDFEAATRTLARLPAGSLPEYALRITALCRAGDTCVREVRERKSITTSKPRGSRGCMILLTLYLATFLSAVLILIRQLFR